VILYPAPSNPEVCSTYAVAVPLGRAVQVEPIKCKLKAPGAERLEL